MWKSSLQNAAGNRRTEVVVQQASDGEPTASGVKNVVFRDFCTRFVEEMLTSGREFQLAMQTIAMLQGILHLPYDDKSKQITARDRVTVDGRILNIAAKPINEGGANETITLWVIEPENPE